jgi:hypothetical protein
VVESDKPAATIAQGRVCTKCTVQSSVQRFAEIVSTYVRDTPRGSAERAVRTVQFSRFRVGRER